jgi:hypothetical protein
VYSTAFDILQEPEKNVLFCRPANHTTSINIIMTMCDTHVEAEAEATLNHSNLLRERSDDVYKKYEIIQVLGNGSMVSGILLERRMLSFSLSFFSYSFILFFFLCTCIYITTIRAP